MDFLNQAISQVRELLLSMTPAARVTALLLVGVIGVSLSFLVKQQSASPDEYLFGGEFLQSSAVNRIEVALGKADLSGYERVGDRIKVPRGKKAAYLAAIADAGALPTNFNELLEEALDLGPFTDRVTREQRLKAAREQQFSMIVSKMSGIENATVIFDIQKPRGLNRKTNATATVSVSPSAGETLDPRQMKRIRQAVAGGIAGLKPDNVIVTNLSDGSMYGGGEEISQESFDDPYYQKRIAYEKYMTAKLENHLYAFKGARVEVTAELDNRLEHTIQSIQPEGEVAALRLTTDEDSTTTSENENGGRPGATAQANTRTAEQTTESVVKNETTSNESQAENFVGTKTEIEVLAGMVPDKIRATVSIPKSYLISVWREQEFRKGNDPKQPLPDDIDTQLENLEGGIRTQVEELVAPLLPRKLAEQAFENVTVTFVETVTPDPIEPPSAASQAFSWAGQNFNTMTMAVVAMVSLMMLRSMVKAIPPSEPAPVISGATLGIETGEDHDESAPTESSESDDPSRPKLRLKKGPSLTDDLTDIVREDPDAAAAILRSWIGNAG
ncbi:MAG: hypothetical protein GXP26_13685 [Planctomycetes bacterium]|nr:hypothetical protein [Planctomycetota bacterium]